MHVIVSVQPLDNSNSKPAKPAQSALKAIEISLVVDITGPVDHSDWGQTFFVLL